MFETWTGTAAAIDEVNYSSATSSVVVDLSRSGYQFTGGSGWDRLISIENVTGSVFSDQFTGTARNSVFNGGLGSDTVSYLNATAGVVLTLNTPGVSQNTVGAGFDTFVSIENLIGSNFADRLTGDAGTNYLSGELGNDSFFGTGGSDLIDGGSGVDTADYSALGGLVTLGAFGNLSKTIGGVDSLVGIETIIATNAIGDTIDLSGAVASATGTTTTLNGSLLGSVTVSGAAPLPLSFNVSKFENVNGSGFADTINGDASANKLNGNGGNDTITGGAGKDILTGGANVDRFIYGALSDSLLADFDVITDYQSGEIIDRPGAVSVRLTDCTSPVGWVSAWAFQSVGVPGTFLILNDGVAGYQCDTDALIHLPSFTFAGGGSITIA